MLKEQATLLQQLEYFQIDLSFKRIKENINILLDNWLFLKKISPEYLDLLNHAF